MQSNAALVSKSSVVSDSTTLTKKGVEERRCLSLVTIDSIHVAARVGIQYRVIVDESGRIINAVFTKTNAPPRSPATKRRLLKMDYSLGGLSTPFVAAHQRAELLIEQKNSSSTLRIAREELLEREREKMIDQLTLLACRR